MLDHRDKNDYRYLPKLKKNIYCVEIKKTQSLFETFDIKTCPLSGKK